MRKILILSLIFLLTVVIALSVLSCNETVDSGYSLALIENVEYQEKGYFEFTVGEIDWTAINFILLDESGAIIGEPITASQSMIYGDDLFKLTSAGTKTVTINYQGASLQITFKLNDPIVIQTYSVVFNAGEGYFEDTNSNIKSLDTDVINAIPRPIRDGYDFQGWYEDQYYTGVPLITPYSLKKNITFYAKWSDKRQYNVEYEIFQDGLSAGVISLISNIEYGTTINLLTPNDITGYDFVYYEVIDSSNNSSIIHLQSGVETYNVDVISNLRVKLCYETKIITLTFISEAWSEGATVNGISISSGIYQKQVEYGTELSKNIDPIPVLPSKEGYTGVWIDMATQKEPVYTIATENITVVANYTIIKFSMSFFDENGVLYENMSRYVNYGGYIDDEPQVPKKTGYVGEWTTLMDGHYEPVSPITIKMLDNVELYARYTPEICYINFHYRMIDTDGNLMTEDYVETLTYNYGDVINNPVDLTVDREIEGIKYKGYNEKYYEIFWYTSSTLINQKTFPSDVVKSADYYYKVVEKPYTVDFRVPEEFANSGLDNVTRTAKDGMIIKDDLPKWIIEGYNIIGWSYTQFAPAFDAEFNYAKDDIVYFDNKYYIAKQASIDVVPNTDSTYWAVTAQNTKYYTNAYIENEGGIPITDFHDYSEDKYYDRAFYPIYEKKQISVSFYSLNIDYVNGEYVYEYELIGAVQYKDYGTTNISSLAPTVVNPSYPDINPDDSITDIKPSQFVFDGWYLERDFVTLPIDLSNFILKEDIILYAKWTDELVGTDGLLFTELYDSNGETIAYQVSGFKTTLAEYSHLTLRIPEKHENKDVVAIADYAFADFSKVLFIDEIIIPSTVVEIGSNAFAACYGLSSFKLNNNTNFIVDAYGVLYSIDYTKLYAVALNNSAFSSLDSYTVHGLVEEIVGGAFAGASNLTSIMFDSSSVLSSIGSYAFDACYNLTSITIPDSVTSIGDGAFRDCIGISTISISSASSLVKVGQNAFDGCEGALDNTTNSDYLLIGNVLVKYLGDDESLTLLDTIVAIADGAFDRTIYDQNSSNYSLSTLYVNSSSNLIYIGSKAFMSCPSLSYINIMKDAKIEIEDDSFDGISQNAKLQVKNSVLNLYKEDANYVDCFGEENIVSE